MESSPFTNFPKFKSKKNDSVNYQHKNRPNLQMIQAAKDSGFVLFDDGKTVKDFHLVLS